MTKSFPLILLILSLLGSSSICQLSDEDVTKIEELINIDLAAVQCTDAPQINEEITNALEKMNKIKIEDYKALKEKIPELLPTIQTLKTKEEEQLKADEEETVEKFDVDAKLSEKQVAKEEFDNKFEENQNTLQEMEQKLDEIYAEKSAKMKENFENMLKPKDEWFNENGIPFDQINKKDEEIVTDINAEIEEGFKKEYGKFADAIIDEGNAPNQQINSEQAVTNAPQPGQQVVVNAPQPGQQTVANAPQPGQQAVANAPQPGQQTVTNAPQPGQQAVANAPQPGQQAVANAPQPGQQAVANAPQPGQQAVANAPQPGQQAVANAPQPGQQTVTNAPQPGQQAVANAPQPGQQAVANAPQPGQQAVANAPQPGQQAIANAPQPGQQAVANAPQPGQQAVANAPQPGQTAESADAPQPISQDTAAPPQPPSFLIKFQNWVAKEESQLTHQAKKKKVPQLRKKKLLVKKHEIQIRHSNRFSEAFDKWVQKQNRQSEKKHLKKSLNNLSNLPIQQQFKKIMQAFVEVRHKSKNEQITSELLTQLTLLEEKLTSLQTEINKMFEIYENKAKLEEIQTAITKMISEC